MKWIILLFLFSCAQLPTPTPQPTEPTQPSVKPEPVEPTEPVKPTLPTSKGYEEIGTQVDAYYRSNNLLRDRGGVNFAQSIWNAVDEGMTAKIIPMDSYLKGVFNIASEKPVSLNQPLCKYDNSMAQRLIRVSLSNNALSLINRFADEVNALDLEGKKAAYSRLMMCLAYSESLGDPDTSRSNTIASREGVSPKPHGVKFYFDSLQTNPDSQINIGLYQFSPIHGGNISPCINDLGDAQRNRKSLVQVLGAQDQAWNARCGVHKILTLFFVSENTTSNSRKAGPACVALHNRNAYNHFGPLQREGEPGGGLTKLYGCYFGSRG